MKKIVTIIACFGILTVFGQCATNPILVQPAVFCVGDSIDLEITNIPFGTTVIWDNSSDSLNGEVYTGSKLKF